MLPSPPRGAHPARDVRDEAPASESVAAVAGDVAAKEIH